MLIFYVNHTESYRIGLEFTITGLHQIGLDKIGSDVIFSELN